ncbi:sensor histidine kinase [Streptomyces sp. NPDC002454]|uniref:sensor histidine kinase n=1 Tax=Streptomyces sp. NPDC049906 TaxID=3155656 RepID=UPI00344899BC
MNTAVRGGLRLVTGLVLGACTAIAELIFVLLAGLLLASVRVWPRGRHAVLRPVRKVGRWLVARERARLATFHRIRLPPLYGGPENDDRALRYLALRWPLGLLGGGALGCLLVGIGTEVFVMFGWLVREVRHPEDLALTALGGLLLSFLAVQGVLGAATWEAGLATRLLTPPQQEEELLRRIEELFTSRTGMVDAVHDERRRIERDLHDGVQQRLVALGMLLGRARRSDDPHRTSVLLRQAHEESQRALVDLREVAWRVYPAALDEAGLEAALSTVVDRAPIPVLVSHYVMRPLPRAVATVAYFVVAETVTNTIKHAEATKIAVTVEEMEGVLYVRIEDNGKGGATPEGSGLVGLARRVAALDGSFTVRSPSGGPTEIIAELPCA